MPSRLSASVPTLVCLLALPPLTAAETTASAPPTVAAHWQDDVPSAAAPSAADLDTLRVPDPTWRPSPFAALAAATLQPEPPAPRRARAFEYSEGYRLRAQIHKYASLATGPLFVAQFITGERLFDGDAGGTTRDAHGALAAGVTGLFAVNTVTGVWNLWEGRKDPNHRTRRVVHSLIMLGCDAGFVITGATAPEHDEGDGNRSLHRKVAITALGVAGANYLFMLLAK